MSVFWDPDRRLWAIDKAQHLAGGLVLGAIAWLLFAPWDALAVVGVGLVAFELGQWDATRSILPSDMPPGYGFGLLDLAVGVVGAGLGIVVVMAVR